MSSIAYCTEIRPEPRLRRVVLLAALVFALLGTLAIALATVPAWLRLPSLAAWIAVSRCEINALRRGWQRCDGVRFHAGGDVEVLVPGDGWRPGALADGSVLLRRFGWIRLVADDGTRIHELVRGSCREDRHWRRLHVIWRHV